MQTYFQSRGYQRTEGIFEPSLFCNIFGLSLGGGSEKSSFKETEEAKKETAQETLAKTTAKSEQVGTTKTAGTKTAEQVAERTDTALTQALDETTEKGTVTEAFSALDVETQELLQSLIADLGEGGLQELTASLTGRALSAEGDLAGIVDPIVAGARGNLEEQLGQTLQGFARTAGGTTQNTIVQQLGLQEGARVEREIADLAATLGLQTRQLATEEQVGAAQLTGGLLTQLTGLLKGAETTRAGETTTDAVRELEQLTTTEAAEKITSEELTTALSETAVSELSETVSESTLNEIINALTKTSGTGKTKGASAGISLGI